MILRKRLSNFPLSIVKSTATFYNKAFHSKIFTLFASSESEVYTFAKRHEPHYDFCFAFMKNDEGQWYLDIDGIQRVREWVISHAIKDAKPVFDLYDMWQKDWEKYLELADRISKTDFKNIGNRELYKIFEEFYLQYLLVGSVAYVADSFMSTGTEDWLEKLVSEDLFRLKVKPSENIRLVRKLTSPVHLSFALDAEYNLIRAADGIKQTFPRKSPKFEELKSSNVYDELKDIEKRFHWIRNNYYNVHYCNAEEFYNEACEIIGEADRNSTTIGKLLKEKKEELESVREERQKLIDSLALSGFIQNILKIARLFSKWKDIRKSGVYIGMHYFDMFLKEVSKRAGYSMEELTFAVFDEIKGILLEKKDIRKELAERKDKCFFAITPEGYYIASGEYAEKYFKFGEAEEDKTATEIKGVSASPGRARGRVHIIRKTYEMSDFKTGEILVTNQTTPEFVPIMKKAAAIVTEQGGITSHAAIVSRELKKPCVIGTKTATSVLMDGEMVTVDADKGIVTRER